MPNLSIKDVPPMLAERLRQRAARHHRSLQGELMSILTDVVAAEDGWQASPQATSAVQPIHHGGTKSPEQVAAEVRRRWPAPVDSGPLAVDILRADRDAR